MTFSWYFKDKVLFAFFFSDQPVFPPRVAKILGPYCPGQRRPSTAVTRIDGGTRLHGLVEVFFLQSLGRSSHFSVAFFTSMIMAIPLVFLMRLNWFSALKHQFLVSPEWAISSSLSGWHTLFPKNDHGEKKCYIWKVAFLLLPWLWLYLKGGKWKWLYLKGTWKIIPFTKWLITMVSI